MKSLDRKVYHQDTVLAATEEEDGMFKLCRYFTEYEDGFGFEFFEMVEVVFHGMVLRDGCGIGKISFGVWGLRSAIGIILDRR